MSSTTNIAVNSRSMNGIITISDGQAVLENGDLTCDDINSSSLTTNNINTSLLTCTGKFECNLNGPYSIPTSISSITGLLIGYGNTTNSGATDFLNYQASYTSTQGGFRFWNKSTTQTLTNLAIIDNSQTYFKSQLVGCTAESPLNTTSVVNKTYVDSNFVDLTNNQSINGLKLFLNKLEVYNTASNAALTLRVSSGTTQQSTISQNGSTLQFLNNSSGATVTYLITGTTRLTISPTQMLLDATCFLTTNDIKSRAPTSTHSLLSDISTGSLTINSITGSNTINGTTSFTNNCNFVSTLSIRNKLKSYELVNVNTDTTLVLTFPLSQTTVIRPPTAGITSITVQLPALTVNEIGMVFNFVKIVNNLNVTLTSTNQFFTLNDLVNGSTTNTTLLSSEKMVTTLVVGFFSTTYYWLEVSNYSTFDRNYNNTIYARLASPNAFTNTNTFNSFLPTSTLTPSAPTQLITKTYADGTFIDFTTDQTISASNKRFNGLFTTALNITPTLGGGGNRQQLYITGQELAFVPIFTSNFYRFYCRDAVYTNFTNPFEISSTSTIVRNNLICEATVTSNNLTSPTSTSTNNIYTNLIAGGIVNIGAIQSNINVKCSLNLIESVYGTTQSTVLNMEGNSCRFTNNGSTNGNYIFTINEVSTYNPLVINKTSVNIAGDTYISGNLILYDTTPSTKTISASLLNNDVTFDPENTVSTTYNFKVNDSVGTLTTPLTISSSATTVSNNLSGQRAFFRTPTANQEALQLYGTGAVDNRLLFIPYSDGAIGYSNIFQNKDSGILFFSEQTVDRGAFCIAPWNTGSAGIRISVANVSIPGPLVTGGQATFNNYTPISSVASPTANNHLTRKDYVDGNFMNLSTAQTKNGTVNFLNQITFNGGSGGGTAIVCNNGLNANTVLNVAGQATFNGTSAFNNTATFSPATITINSTTSSHNVNLFSAITSGTINFFSSLANSAVSMFSSSTNDVTLDINAKVKFRQVKLYNQVKTITGNTTLSFPLEEQVVIKPTATIFIDLPLLTANSLGMTFNFITNSTTYAIWFSTQGTDNIIKNGYITGNTSSILLGTNGVTTLQFTCLELNTGVYSWSFLSSLPEKVSNPPGTIITMAVQSTPLGYLACDGGSYSFGGIYSNLYAVIGTTYGTGGVGTFKVPNFNNGSFLRGVGGNAGAIATQQQDNIKTHTHNIDFGYLTTTGSSGGNNAYNSTGPNYNNPGTGTGRSTVTINANSAGSPDETRPINYAVHYCIKY